MNQSATTYFLNSKVVLLSIGLAFFLTNCIELLMIFLSSYFSKQSFDINFINYFTQSIVLLSSLWLAFKLLKNVPIYIIALSVGVISTTAISAILLLSSKPTIESLLAHFISTFALIFIWMHLTQNLENKPKALKIGYFSFFIVVGCLGLISSSIAGNNHIAFLLLSIIGYKISSVIFELMIKIAFKLMGVNTPHNHQAST
jgi:hypothetical protein